MSFSQTTVNIFYVLTAVRAILNFQEFDALILKVTLFYINAYYNFQISCAVASSIIYYSKALLASDTGSFINHVET